MNIESFNDDMLDEYLVRNLGFILHHDSNLTALENVELERHC